MIYFGLLDDENCSSLKSIKTTTNNKGGQITLGFNINRKLFEDNSRYVRTALVAYTAFFADGSDFSKKEYLERIIKDAFGCERVDC